MNPLHDKKGWWHSDLLRFSNNDGTVTIMFKGDPAESKYPGKPKWCGINVEGPDGHQSEHTLNVEPEVEAQIIAAPKDVWLKAMVQGGKGERPGIYIEDDAGPVFPGETPQYSTPPNKTSYTPTRKSPVLVSEVMEDAVTVSVEAVRRFKLNGVDIGPSEAQGIFSTIFIQMCK